MDQMKQQMMKKVMADALNKIGKGVPVEYKGRMFMPGISRECMEYLQEWDMPENSVIISSFPKTGTAWTTEIVRNILYIKDEELLERSKSIPPPMFGLELGPKMKYDFFPQLPLPRKFFATHVPEEFFNFEKMKQNKGKMIYVMRNPKDQAVSWYHFSKKLVSEEMDKHLGEDWNDFFAKYVNGEHPTGLLKGEFYPDHLRDWMKHKGDEDFLIVVYEDMKKDFCGEIRRIANFLEIELNEEDAKRVAENCSIASMKKAAEHDQSGLLKKNVRKGQVGGWKDELTVSQSDLMDRLIEEKLSSTGIKFTYVL